jgi:hypothetical protein
MTTQHTTDKTGAAQCPPIIPRGPYDDSRPNGYLEGDRDYTAKNMEAAVWLLDNAHRLSEDNKRLRAALEAAVERMEAVSVGIPVENRHEGVSQATHVRHMAGHLAQHAKLARTALEQTK